MDGRERKDVRPGLTVGVVIKQDQRRAFYMQQRAKGKSHQVAVRALVYKLIRIIYRCWQTHQPYSEVEYLESLRRKGSPLLKYIAESPA